MKISKIFEIPSVQILLFIHGKGEVRYTDLTKLIASRGTLSANLKELEKEELIKRRVITTKSIQTYYSLTEKGQKIAKAFNDVKEHMQSFRK
ncbi:MAG: helix-turn-helix transcriptional regulator [Candidatus Brockarchaeota archaeon]|nr:helix-turn-helix transcriptional regulator [Candidatus Brockarchaeota archaeon]